MNIQRAIYPAIAIIAYTYTGCINIKMVNVGQKTAFERQLTGTYEELDDNLATIASVRDNPTVNNASNQSDNSDYNNALDARRRQLFNLDDIEKLKADGCLGENLRGQLTIRQCEQTTANQTLAALAERLVTEENADRQTIMQFAIQLDKSLSSASINDMRTVYYKLMKSQAKSGYYFEESPGQWQKID